MKFFYKKIIPISLTEKMLFTRNLAVMVKSGVSLPRALEILGWQIKHPALKSAVFEIKENIQEGAALIEAFNKHKRVFNNFYIGMIKVGETSGNLEYVLNVLAQQMEKEHQLITKIKGAMLYPVLILITLIGISVAMLVLVIPKLIRIFSEMQVELPWNTKLILVFASNARLYGLYLLLVLAALSGAFYFYRRTSSGKKTIHWLLFYLPFWGKMSQKVNLARLAANLSSLLEADVPLLEALKITKGTLANSVYKTSIENILKKTRKGDSLSQSLSSYPKLYSPLLVQMVKVGEETGATASALAQAAEFYQNEIDETMKNISSVIEPVLMIIIGAIVGFFAVSMISPIYSMLQQI